MARRTTQILRSLGLIAAYSITISFAIAEGHSLASDSDTPSGMLLISGGEFIMGSDHPAALENERPAHKVKVESFWLDQHPVTNAQFSEFVAATNYVTVAERKPLWEDLKKQLPPDTPQPPEEVLQPGSLVFTPPNHPVNLRDMSSWWTWTIGASWKHPQGPQSDIVGKELLPVVHIAWDDAVAYATWAGKRLPTEAEWEYAARAGSGTSRYYWGDTFKLNGRYMANTFTGEFPYKNTASDGYDRVAPVKSFPPNSFGLYDMAGNVWQWTSDKYRPDTHQYLAQGKSPPPGCHDPTSPVPDTETRVIKGGSFLCSLSYCESYRPSARRGTPPDTSSEHVGFRCAKSKE